jgi:DNA-binding NarL/FixJ family response regulator
VTIRVFLADDHAVMRDGVRFLLEGEPDIRVVGDAADGRTTVRLVAQLLPDVVLMDITMPELNGIEATARIRAAHPATQVVILTMHSTSEHIYRALQAGALGYILKESAGTEVTTAVRAVHAGRRYISPRIVETMPEVLAGEPRAKSPLESLSPREREILQLVVEGQSSSVIATALALSAKTVETYRSRLMLKLGISDLPTLVKFAVEHGLTPGT